MAKRKRQPKPALAKRAGRRIGQFIVAVAVLALAILQFTNFAGFVGRQWDTVYSWAHPLRISTNDPVYGPDNPIGVFDRGVVTIAFDDGWASIRTEGLQLMEDHNFNSTQYIVTGVLGKHGYMTYPQVQDFQRAGHQIASHTETHANLTQLPYDSLLRELKEPKQFIGDNFVPTEDFASPLGAFHSEMVMDAIKNNYRSHRTSTLAVNTKDKFNIYDLQSYVVTSENTTADVARWLTEARDKKAWVILTYHQLESGKGLTYGISKAEFKKHLNLIKDSGLPVATVGQVLDEIDRQDVK